MGIKLDWQVESENTQMTATEDPDLRRRRRLARLRLLLLIGMVVCLFGAVVGAVVWRWREAEAQFRQDLLDTVEIEVTALRIGDYEGFMAIQRSISDTFLLEQSRRYNQYQQLKQQNRLNLTGRVLDDAIRDRTGRVVLEEVVDGVAYKTVWFYWYYEDGDRDSERGWRRVPDDLEFWGDERELDQGAVEIRYRDLDAELAEALAPLLNNWWTVGCARLQCASVPPQLRVEIVAARPPSVEWDSADPSVLRITSPLLLGITAEADDRARVDDPVPPKLERAIAEQVAQRLVRHAAGGAAPVSTRDAAWLHLELARWLAGVFLGSEADGGFTGTVIAQYGPNAPAVMLRALAPDATLDTVLTAVTGVPVSLLTVDQLSAYHWQAFFQWRLDLESRLLNQGNGGAIVLELYDMETPTVAQLAQARIADPAYAARGVPQVGAVVIAPAADAQIYALVEVTYPETGQTETIQWRLAGGTWKRAS